MQHRCVNCPSLVAPRRRYCSDACYLLAHIAPANEDGCMLWNGPVDREGNMQAHLPVSGKCAGARRAAYAEANPTVVLTTLVAVVGTCGESLCVAPEHSTLKDVRRKPKTPRPKPPVFIAGAKDECGRPPEWTGPLRPAGSPGDAIKENPDMWAMAPEWAEDDREKDRERAREKARLAGLRVPWTPDPEAPPTAEFLEKKRLYQERARANALKCEERRRAAAAEEEPVPVVAAQNGEDR